MVRHREKREIGTKPRCNSMFPQPVRGLKTPDICQEKGCLGSMKIVKSFFFSILLIVFASRCVASVTTLDTKSIPNGVLGESYFAVLMASGGCTPYSWRIVS